MQFSAKYFILSFASSFFQFERQKKEREIKKKQEALTLEETKEQIAQLEAQLNQHKEEKHQVRLG